mmetsp:Transcript_10625/g.21448  ORF Transcript_10625/g.21448 Transcript_10625/m.21448 type:complete len:232 (-) Transcript_10625:3139-3834(-)
MGFSPLLRLHHDDGNGGGGTPTIPSSSSSSNGIPPGFGGGGGSTGTGARQRQQQPPEPSASAFGTGNATGNGTSLPPLPPDPEEMKDTSNGRTFYVDHVRKVPSDTVGPEVAGVAGAGAGGGGWRPPVLPRPPLSLPRPLLLSLWAGALPAAPLPLARPPFMSTLQARATSSRRWCADDSLLLTLSTLSDRSRPAPSQGSARSDISLWLSSCAAYSLPNQPLNEVDGVGRG